MARGARLFWKEHRFESGPVYRGSWQGSKKEGRGWWRHPDGDSYEGEYHCNMQHGWGVFRFAAGHEYMGQWVAGKKHGRGVYVYAGGEEGRQSEMYIGEYHNDQRHGRGLYRHRNGMVKEQEYHAGRRITEKDADAETEFEYFKEFMEIRARCDECARNLLACSEDCADAAVEREFQTERVRKSYQYSNGAEYEGQFLGSKRHGSGLWYNSDGDTYAGQYQYNRHHGWGAYNIHRSGKKYVGSWRRGQMDGWGVYCFNSAETEYYVGTYQDDRKHGRGMYCYPSGAIKLQVWDKGVLQRETDCSPSMFQMYDSIRDSIVAEVQGSCSTDQVAVVPAQVARADPPTAEVDAPRRGYVIETPRNYALLTPRPLRLQP
eukprot:TRINITY_DN55393_c0_g1_i1.p2 TRINITY_DN55393_c0_g1~~TRINITY_DN55393_c0_g1_i1.p2  ORF type:complete len:416 (+),score=127.93 TRINITY_DN55393_c0_g1_i1:125-1249(+)